MACCIVAALVLAFTGRLTPWRRRPDLDGGFAPVATRPAAGTRTVFPPVHQAPPRHTLTARRAALGWFLRFAATATMTYLLCSALVVWSGIALHAAPRQEWLPRTAVLVAVAAGAALYGSRTLAGGRDTTTRPEIVGYALAAAGIVALELMVLDMHLLALYHLPPGFGHDLFQVLCVISIGTGALLVGGIRARPQPDVTQKTGELT